MSVYGYIIIYLCGAPIAWKSKSGKSVILSSTEAEYFALSEVAKEIIFVKQLVDSMGYKISYTIMIKVDNVGAIYLANNHTTSQRTKYIDIHQHFAREYIEDAILKVIFVNLKTMMQISSLRIQLRICSMNMRVRMLRK
jgi:hypothetical protein